MNESIKGITIVSPMWGERNITDRMIFSVIHQYISKDNLFKIHLVLVDDYIEGRLKNNESIYEYYLSDEFKKFYDSNNIKISLIKNKEHKYQGESREIGFLNGDYPFFLLLDCDDILAPNACDRYLNILDSYLTDEKNNDIRKVACVYGLIYSFDTNGYEHNIEGNNIWVQGRCFNREFIIKHDIHFPTGLSSQQGEDYPFMRKFDYAAKHDDEYEILSLDFSEDKNCQCTAYWFPNHDSLSRRDPHYSQHLSGWTMKSSHDILDYYCDFNEKNGFVDEEDEFMKHEYLNMNIYAFYNLLDFIKEISSTDYIPIKEDWYALRDAVKGLRTRLKDKYYDEIIYSDIEDMMYNVKHYSDVHFTESWIGTFYDYMNEEHSILNMSYDEIIEYAKTLEFDEVGHEIHSPQVVAWNKRHNL